MTPTTHVALTHADHAPSSGRRYRPVAAVLLAGLLLTALPGARVGHADSAVPSPAHTHNSLNGPLLVLYETRSAGMGPNAGELAAVEHGRIVRVLVQGMPYPFMGGLAASPDGSTIAFGEDSDGNYAQSPHSKTEGLWLTSSGGTGLRRFLLPPQSTNGNTLGIGPVAWSPDGHTLAYAVNIAGGVENLSRPEGSLGIWLTRADTARPRLLATAATLGIVTHTGAALDITGLSWSSDGRTLAVSAGYAGDRKIVALDVATGQARLVIRGGQDGAYSPTGRVLAYITGDWGVGGGMRLWLIDTQARHARVLIATHGLIAAPVWSPDGRSIAYIDGAPFGVGGTAIRILDVATRTSRVMFTTGRHWQHAVPREGYFVHLAWLGATAAGGVAGPTKLTKTRAGPTDGREPVQLSSASPGRVRSFVLAATQEIWLDNGYAGLHMDTAPLRIQTRLWYASPTRWRVERYYLTPPAQRAFLRTFLPGPNVSVRNGPTWWTYDSLRHTATVQSAVSMQDVPPSESSLWFESAALETGIPARAARNLHAYLAYVAACDMPKGVPVSTPALAGRDTVAGHAAYVIDFGNKPCGWTSASAPEMMGRRLLWVDQQTFFLLKLVRYSVMYRPARPRDRYFERIAVTRLRYSVPLPASIFAFRLPPRARLAPTATQPTTAATVKPLAEIRREVSFPLFVPAGMPGGLRLIRATVDSAQGVTLDYDAPGKHVSILEGPLGCCLDADPRKYGGPILPDGHAVNLLDVGARFGGLILWWDQDGTYIALSSATLSRGDLTGIATAISGMSGTTAGTRAGSLCAPTAAAPVSGSALVLAVSLHPRDIYARDGAVQLCLLTATRPPRPLYRPLPTSDIDVSADGRSLAFGDTTYHIHLVRLAHGTDRVIGHGVLPRFSYDGRYLAFITSATLPLPTSAEHLVVYDLTSGRLTRVGPATLPRIGAGFSGPITLFAWAPHADTLAWAPNLSRPGDIAVVPVGHPAARRSVTLPIGHMSSEVIWSADGGGLLYWHFVSLGLDTDAQAPHYSLMRWRLPDGPAETVVASVPTRWTEGMLPAPASDAAGTWYASLLGTPRGGFNQVTLYAHGRRPLVIPLPGEPRLVRFAPTGAQFVTLWTPPYGQGIASHAALIDAMQGRVHDLGPALGAFWIRG